MGGRLVKWVAGLLSLFVTFALAIGAFTAVKNAGWLSPFGIDSESHDSQVIQAIKRTQEVSLLSLGIEGIKEEDQQAHTVFGMHVPGTGKQLFLQYGFTAKLGIDGAEVKVKKTGNHAYLISVPDFKFIGTDKQHFKVADEKSGVLGWTTPDIDETKVVNTILNDGRARQKYIDSNRDTLEDQTKVFYRSLITSVDPDTSTTFRFSA